MAAARARRARHSVALFNPHSFDPYHEMTQGDLSTDEEIPFS